MADGNATRAERIALARCATCQIQGLTDAVLDIIRRREIAWSAPQHHATLGMLAQIRELSDDVFNLQHGDDDITRDEVNAMMTRMGIEHLELNEEEATHG